MAKRPKTPNPKKHPVKAKTRVKAPKPPAKKKADYYGPGPSENPDLAGPLELGPIVLPTNYEQAVKLIEEFTALNDAVLQAAKRHSDAASVAKKRKGEWDDAAKALSDRLRQATHKANLPLFDQGERDAELAGMTENKAETIDAPAVNPDDVPF